MTFKLTLTTLAALAFAPQAMADGHVDTTDASATAFAIIKGFRTQNGPAIAALLNDTNANMAPMLSALPQGDPEWGELWSSWRQAGLDVWDGTTLPAKARNGDPMEAIIPFAYDGPDGAVPLSGTCGSCRYLVIVLTKDSASDTSWGFEDINGSELANYAADPALN